MTRSPPPPLYAPPDAEESAPKLDPSMIEDDDDLGIAVDEFVHANPEARARQREIALHTDALRVADSETWPLFVTVETLMNGRWADVIVEVARWAFKEGQRFPRSQTPNTEGSP